MQDQPATAGQEIARLVRELEEAEAYAQKLRAFIMDIKDQLAAGHTERALSMLNEALRDIDDVADVVAPTDRRVRP
jgi:hypothetical protein